MDPSQPKTFFDALPSKQAFWLGFVTAILALGTLGFILLGSCILKGECAVENFARTQGTTTDKVASNTDIDKNLDQASAPSATTTAGVPAVNENDHVRGDLNAPITIIEYSDFECPYCQRFHPTMQQVMEEYAGQVRWVYRHFPLSFHPNATSAALAAECAGEQDKFWEMGDALFENRESLGEELYVQLASSLELNMTEFNDCYENQEYADHIDADAQGGAAAGVTGTPGSFIIDQDGNAIPIKGALPFESIAAAIDSVL